MALIKCTECGKDVSDRASACPNCGCPMDAILADQEQQRIEEEKREEERKVGEEKRKDEERLKQARIAAANEENARLVAMEEVRERKNKILTVCLVLFVIVIMIAVSSFSKKSQETARKAKKATTYSTTAAPAETEKTTAPTKKSYSSGSSGSSSSSYIDDDMKAGLAVYCEKVVSAHLKSPSSAKFPLYTKYSYEKGTDNTYSIVGYVDAQNSYGADIRETWGVMVQYDGHTTTLLMVQIGEDIYIP